jgi:glucosyl-dolichyl phosphate glucuronosyltransferase
VTEQQLSVIVCTYNRYDELANCLDALRPQSQTIAAKQYQVVVVDNTPKPARRSKSGYHCSKWIVCDQVGLSNARNAGIETASGDVIAFVDDDAIVGPEWCKEVISAFDRNPEALAIGGKVIPEFPGSIAPRWLTSKQTEYLSCIDWGDDEHILEPDPKDGCMGGGIVIHGSGIHRDGEQRCGRRISAGFIGGRGAVIRAI